MLPVSADHVSITASSSKIFKLENDYLLLCQSQILEKLLEVHSTLVCCIMWPNKTRQNFPLLEPTRARDNSDCTVGGLY